MFKFNFNETEAAAAPAKPEVKADEPASVKQSQKLEITAERYAEIASEVTNSESLNLFVSDEIEIGYLDSSLLPTDYSSNTDLIPAVYEGGFKIWECTQDLADHLTVSNELIEEFEGASVCDLGCSAGILGMLALLSEASRVDFQDYVSSSPSFRC